MPKWDFGAFASAGGLLKFCYRSGYLLQRFLAEANDWVPLTMDLPHFYVPGLRAGDTSATLDDTNTRHAVQVLRMQVGSPLVLVNGNGLEALASINAISKKSCSVMVESIQEHKPPHRRTAIAISPVKNTSRLEWFLEKATELGVAEIIPIICHRTVKEHFRNERYTGICVSAMLQSKQAFLPILYPPVTFAKLLENEELLHRYHHKWIAHCAELEKHHLVSVLRPGMETNLILIGPEGDFTQEEIVAAEKQHFNAVALGDTRLRTETAGVVAAALLQLLG
jgi:16S rRNA (uracil1498-N3)-methyltransferase